jgi:hypothetical protein
VRTEKGERKGEGGKREGRGREEGGKREGRGREEGGKREGREGRGREEGGRGRKGKAKLTLIGNSGGAFKKFQKILAM